MSATAAARSIVRSASPRAAASLPSVAPKLRGCPKSTFSPFRSSKQTPVSLRISRSPVELSCSLETLLPYHTATASSLLTSKLSVSRIGYSWTLEDGKLFFGSCAMFVVMLWSHMDFVRLARGIIPLGGMINAKVTSIW